MPRGRFSQTYLDHLRSPYWQSLRRYVFDQADYHCARCGKHTLHLDLDHLHYRTLGFELPQDVQALCRKCHQKKTTESRLRRRRRRKRSYSQSGRWLLLISIAVAIMVWWRGEIG